MPSFDAYQKMYGGKTQGQVRKDDSDQIMLATWNEDIDSKVAYFYSKTYDSEFESETDLQPYKTKKIPIDIKFFEIEYNSLNKDEVPYHIMFKPGFDYKSVISYYDEEFNSPYEAEFPDGLFVDIPDEKGIYRRWVCVGQYRRYSNQFPSFLVLPVNHKLQWVYNRQKYESWCCLRSQNSYNAGEWSGRNIRIAENQKILWLPMTSETANIFYDLRMCISEPREEPLVWHVSKVEDMDTKGVLILTAAQDRFDEHTDYIEKDDEGRVIGQWASYWDINDNPAEDPELPPSTTYCTITHSGTAAEIKTGGSYKKLTVTFYDTDGETTFQPGTWSFTVDGVDISSLLTIKTKVDDPSLADNQIKIKFAKDDSYIGKNLEVKFEATTTGIKDTQLINIVGL